MKSPPRLLLFVYILLSLPHQITWLCVGSIMCEKPRASYVFVSHASMINLKNKKNHFYY